MRTTTIKPMGRPTHQHQMLLPNQFRLVTVLQPQTGLLQQHQLHLQIIILQSKQMSEIQGKMKAIQNVIEMLSSIIKDGKSVADLEASLNEVANAHENAWTATPEKKPF
ncbi:unnamed protein product [Acanthoscelides obtectus]|uniref:Uncharacterized protein n=1 Tax=Acanthoscelides obtectus TaxID=200917 RepID=A0A9P0QFE0_ACAOB|nr:unnamed protein product [Acanthoscelides obtectus]CAK1643349.1 hypothetical protein AOBTE_LOCUS13505 [Acanthoscelides obtectus]